MVVLDTDHLSALAYDSVMSRRFKERLVAAGQEIATTAISCEEQVEGLLAALHRHTDPANQIHSYAELVEGIEFLARFVVLPWDEDSATLFREHRGLRVRCGTRDLKIACIILAHDTTLLTRNTRDFAHVPGLKFENWLD